MSDRRFQHPYRRLGHAVDVAREIEQMRDDELVQALSAMSREALLGNVVASALMNRLRLKNGTLAVAGEGLCALDARGRIRLMNPAAERMLGRRFADVVAQDMRGLVEPGSATQKSQLERCLTLANGGAATRVDDDAFMRADGSTITVGYTLAPVLRDGEVDGFVLVFRDTTELRRVLLAYNRSERALKETLVLARLGRWDWDLVRDEVTWNEEMYTLVGVELGEFEGTGEAFVAHLPDADRARFTRLVHAPAGGEMEFGLTHRFIRPDGAERAMRTQGSLVRGAKRDIIGAWGTMQDVTEWHESPPSSARE